MRRAKAQIAKNKRRLVEFGGASQFACKISGRGSRRQTDGMNMRLLAGDRFEGGQQRLRKRTVRGHNNVIHSAIIVYS